MKTISQCFFLGCRGVFFGAVLICCLAHADDVFTLKRTYKTGEVETFTTTINLEPKDAPKEASLKLGITFLTTETVKNVSKDGDITIESTLVSGKINVGGTEQELPNSGQKMTFVLDKNGRVIKQETAGGGKSAGPIQMLAMTRPGFFPDKPLKIGEEFKFELNGSEGLKGAPITKGAITVVGMEKISAEVPVETVKVKLFVDTTLKLEAEMKIHMDGEALIEPKTGRAYLTTGKITGLQIPQIGQATMQYKRRRMTDSK